MIPSGNQNVGNSRYPIMGIDMIYCMYLYICEYVYIYTLLRNINML